MTYLTSVANGIADGGSTTHSSNAFSISGTNKVVYAFVPMSDSSPVAPNSVTLDTTGVNQAFSKLADSGTFGSFANCSLWRLINPSDVTSKTVDIVWGSAVGERAVIVLVETDLDQTTPNGTVATGTGTGTTVSTSAVSTSVGQRVITFGHALRTGVFSGPTEFDSPTGTERQDTVTSGTAYDAFALQEQTATGATVTSTWSLNDGVDGWYAFSFAVNAAGAGPSTSKPLRKSQPARLAPYLFM